MAEEDLVGTIQRGVTGRATPLVSPPDPSREYSIAEVLDLYAGRPNYAGKHLDIAGFVSIHQPPVLLATGSDFPGSTYTGSLIDNGTERELPYTLFIPSGPLREGKRILTFLAALDFWEVIKSTLSIPTSAFSIPSLIGRKKTLDTLVQADDKGWDVAVRAELTGDANRPISIEGARRKSSVW